MTALVKYDTEFQFFLCVCVCVCVCMFVCMYVGMYVCVCVYVCVYIYIWVIHRHTCSLHEVQKTESLRGSSPSCPFFKYYMQPREKNFYFQRSP